MQINPNIQSNVLMAQNKGVQKSENTVEQNINENKIEKNEERKHQNITPIQDDMISKALENPKADLKDDLAKIDENLKKAINNDKFKNEDFSKLKQDMLKQNEESFKNAQQVSLNQTQIAQLLA